MKGLVITLRPIIGIVTIPWVVAMALFASFEYGNFSQPIHTDPSFYLTLLLIVIASYLGVTSGYAVNDYYDAELDMFVPLPKAVKYGLPKKTLLVYAAILGVPSLLILFYLSILTGIIGIIQMLSIFTYSKFMKGRVSYSNLFVVIPTALMPISVFFVYTEQLTIEAVLLFATFFFFEPGFTWSGVCRDTPHDKKRGVPTLPVIYGIKAVAKFILVCWIGVLVMSMVLFLATDLGMIFYMGSLFSALIIIGLAIKLIRNPHPGIGASTFIKSSSWFWLFSFSVIIDVVLRMAGVMLPHVNILG